MSNFIIIGTRGADSNIRTAVFGDISENNLPNVRYMYAEKATGLGRMVQRVVTSKKLNRHIKMPLSMHWEVNYKQVKPYLSDTEDNYVIFVPGEQMFQRTSPDLIRKLRRHHKNCKLVFYFVDGIERCYTVNGYDEAYMFRFLAQFDLVCTYSRDDAKKYNIPFIDIPVRNMPAPEDSAPAYSLHFSGLDKKRVGMLIEIKRRLNDAGINHFFHVVPSRATDLNNKEIEYGKVKPYPQIVEDSLRSNCLLEILAMYNTSATLRYKEAIMYNKKLLTNNPQITQLPYYDARWMHYFEKAEDIDLDWLRTIEPIDYGYKGEFSGFAFLDTVVKLCKP